MKKTILVSLFVLLYCCSVFAGKGSTSAPASKPAAPARTQATTPGAKQTGGTNLGAGPKASPKVSTKTVPTETVSRAKSQGTIFKSRTDLTQRFRQNLGSKYPTKFSSQPTSRPRYIPQYYNSHELVFYIDTYGWWDNSTWVVYDPWEDEQNDEILQEEGYLVEDEDPNWGIIGLVGVGCMVLILIFAGLARLFS